MPNHKSIEILIWYMVTRRSLVSFQYCITIREIFDLFYYTPFLILSKGFGGICFVKYSLNLLKKLKYTYIYTPYFAQKILCLKIGLPRIPFHLSKKTVCN
jgi:hypothetical protein